MTPFDLIVGAIVLSLILAGAILWRPRFFEDAEASELPRRRLGFAVVALTGGLLLIAAPESAVLNWIGIAAAVAGLAMLVRLRRRKAT